MFFLVFSCIVFIHFSLDIDKVLFFFFLFLRSRTDGYGDSWVQRQLGTGTVGYSDKRVQMRQLGTGTIGYRSWRQLGTGTIGYRGRRQLGTGTNGYKWCDEWVQRQSGTSVTKGKATIGYNGATNGYSDNRIQVRHSGTATIGCMKNVKKVVRRLIRTCESQ